MDLDCEKLDRWLEVFRDGELPPADQRRVEAHVRECPSCEARLEEIRSVERELAQVLVPDASDEGALERMAQRVAVRIAEIGDPPPYTAWQRIRDLVSPPGLERFRLPALGAAAAIVVFFLALVGARAVRHGAVQEARLSHASRAVAANYVHATDPAVQVNFVDEEEPQWTVVWISKTDAEDR